MAKRTIKPSKQQPEVKPEVKPEQNGEAEKPAAICPNCGGRGAYEGGDGDECASCNGSGEKLPEQPVTAADLLDTPEQPPVSQAEAEHPTHEQFTASLIDPAAEPFAISGPCSACGSPDHWRPDCPKIAAEVKFRKDMQEAKDDYISASVAVKEIESDLKSAKKRQKDALTFFQELEARGPVVAKPITPPEEQSGTQQPLPGAGDSGQGEGESAWRTIPLSELPVETITGLGKKKLEALYECCPTLGRFVDKQVEAGASGVNTVLPKGIGKAITDPLEEMLLDYLCKWRNERGQATDVSTQLENDAGRKEESCVRSEPDAAASTTTATTAASEASNIPSFTEWELMTTEQQHEYINNRAAYLLNAHFGSLTAAVQSGQLSQGRSESITDCPYVPGEEMDDWILGFQGGERVDESDAHFRGEDHPEPELVSASVGELAATSSSPVYSELDDI